MTEISNSVRGRLGRLIAWAHVVALWLLVGAALALEWRPLGTLDFLRFHVECRWTAPMGDAKAGPPP